MGDDGAEYSSNVASSECDYQLFSFGAVRSGLGYNVPERLGVSNSWQGMSGIGYTFE